VVAVAAWARSHPEPVVELDLNPVIVGPAGQGLAIVDALAVVGAPGPGEDAGGD
jgi:hypothetical protein